MNKFGLGDMVQCTKLVGSYILNPRIGEIIDINNGKCRIDFGTMNKKPLIGWYEEKDLELVKSHLNRELDIFNPRIQMINFKQSDKVFYIPKIEDVSLQITKDILKVQKERGFLVVIKVLSSGSTIQLIQVRGNNETWCLRKEDLRLFNEDISAENQIFVWRGWDKVNTAAFIFYDVTLRNELKKGDKIFDTKTIYDMVEVDYEKSKMIIYENGKEYEFHIRIDVI